MIDFFKYNSAGNDFILVDNRLKIFPKETTLIQQFCDRNFGIGADGLILLELDNNANYFMHYFNSDGLPSSLCGNGSMCCGHFANEMNLLNKSLKGFEGSFSTNEGVFNVNVNNNHVCISMPNVSNFIIDNQSVIINTGSPHYVVFTSKLDSLDINKEAIEINNRAQFCANGINVTFVQKKSEDIFIRTYERGVDSETLSCGTGVVAAVLSLFIRQIISFKDQISVNTPGGILQVSYQYNNHENFFSNITLSNKVSMVYSGKIPLPKF